jgi:hypothetical protein
MRKTAQLAHGRRDVITISGAKRPMAIHPNFLHGCCVDFPGAGMLRWTAVQVQSRRVKKQVEKMPHVPRDVGCGCHETVGAPSVAFPKTPVIGGLID